MKRFVLKYWCVLPPLLCACMLGLMLLINAALFVIESIVFGMFLLVIILLPVSWIMLLINKRWWQCLISFVLSIAVFAVLGVPLSMTAMDGPDGFGKKHGIPEDLEYQLPLDADSGNGVVVDSLDSDTYLQIWNGIQGGYYFYDFFYSSIPDGEVFLRCYEATENIPLSEGSIPKRSTVSVSSTDGFSQLVSQKDFTIYEGDWGDYYAARIEVWFRDSESKQERKLCEKVYRVDGWMR